MRRGLSDGCYGDCCPSPACGMLELGLGGLMGNDVARQIMPVVDPSLPAQTRHRLIRKIRHSKSDESDKSDTVLGCGFMVGIAFVVGSVVLHFTTGLTWWWAGGSAISLIAFMIIGGVASSTPTHDEHDHFVGLSDLDTSSQRLLLRAQRAISTVLQSGVYAEDLLDQAAGEMVLRRHEWEIAVTLRDITNLRAELTSQSSVGEPGPMTAAVLDSHGRALALAEQATTSRVSALESYAAQVQVADAAQRDWQNAMKLSGLNEKYLDLVARTAADEHALAEITGLTEQAATAVEVFRDSLHEAILAAQPLVLPDSPQT